MTRYALAVDIGSISSIAAVARGSRVEVCALGTSAPEIPSTVALLEDGTILAGEAAERAAPNEPARVARDFLPRLGDPAPIIIGGTPYGAEALVGHLLRTIVEQVTAEEKSGPDTIVLTHPANYSDFERGLLLEACRLAGLDLSGVRLLSAPEAAAVGHASQDGVVTGVDVSTSAVVVGAALAGAATLESDDVAGPRGLGAAGAAGGAAVVGGGAAALGTSALLGGGPAAAAAAAAATAAAGPVGIPLAAGPAGIPLAAGPAGVPLAAGPAGIPLAPGPVGTPIPGAAPPPGEPMPVATPPRVRRPPRPRLRAAIGAGVAVGAAVVAGVVVAAPFENDDQATGPTTTAVAPIATTPSPASSTVPPSTSARGLSGLVTVVAGNGRDDGGGRPGPAESASLGNAARFAVAPNGDLFVVNHDNELLLVSGGQTRVIYEGDTAAGEVGFGGVAVGPNGDAYVTMGTGVKRIGRDGSSELVVDARAQSLERSFGPIAIEESGSITFFDSSGFRVLRWTVGAGLSVMGGTGAQAQSGSGPEGDGGPATAARLAGASAMVVDSDGGVLLAETGRARVRRIAPDGTIATIAGGGTIPLAASGGYAPDATRATDLKFTNVSSVAVDSRGRVYVSDDQDHAIVRIGADGSMELLAADQIGSVAEFDKPANGFKVFGASGLTIDPSGDLLFAQDNRVLRIASAAGS